MQNGYDLYPSEYNFKYFTRLQCACSTRKLQTNYAVLTFCDFKHRLTKKTVHGITLSKHDTTFHTCIQTYEQ